MKALSVSGGLAILAIGIFMVARPTRSRQMGLHANRHLPKFFHSRNKASDGELRQ